MSASRATLLPIIAKTRPIGNCLPSACRAFGPVFIADEPDREPERGEEDERAGHAISQGKGSSHCRLNAP